MNEIEFMMERFGLTEENARKAIADGFKAGALMGADGMDWIRRESGIEHGLSDAATRLAELRRSFEEPEK